MPAQKKSTLRSSWWTSLLAKVRYCYACGHPLIRRYIKGEGAWRRVCVSCQTITYINPRVVAGLIPVMPDGRLLLVRRAIEPGRGLWSYPAGYQEMGESVETAAVRETWEEARVKCNQTTFLGVYSYADAGVVTVVYAGRIPSGEIPHQGLETEEVKLFKWQEIPWKKLAFRSTEDALQDWVKRRNGDRL